MQKKTFFTAVLALTLLARAANAADGGYHIIDRIPAPDGNGEWNLLHVDQKNNRLLVSHGSSLMTVDLATKQVNDKFSGTRNGRDAIPINDGAQVLIPNAASTTVMIVEAHTGQSMANLPAGGKPNAAVYDASTGLVLVTKADGNVMLINARTFEIAGNIPVGGMLEQAAVDGAGKAYVTINDQNQIAVIDIAAKKLLTHFSLTQCETPSGIAYAPADKLLVVACDGGAQVIDATNGELVKNFLIGGGAEGIAFDADKNMAFVPSGKLGTLSVISVSKTDSKLVETVNTQAFARTVALDNATGRLYLPTAKFGMEHANMLPGTFEILVLGK